MQITKIHTVFGVFGLLLSLAFVSGCATSNGGDEVSNATAPQGPQYLLDEEPTGAVTFEDAIAALKEAEKQTAAAGDDGEKPEEGVETADGTASNHAASNNEVVVVARISGGDDVEPWSDGEATFLIKDANPTLEKEDKAHGGKGHDEDNCPFCKRRKAKRQAIVEFHDKNGEILKIDARDLLGVKKDQLIVVRGQGELDELGHLVVAASGIYKRP